MQMRYIVEWILRVGAVQRQTGKKPVNA